MANITLSIDDALLQAAQIRAVEEGTTLNEICRRAIERYAHGNDQRLARYLELRARLDANPGVTAKSLPAMSRGDLYDTVLAERGLSRRRGRRK